MSPFKLQHSKVLLFTGLMMLAAGLPVSLFLTSLSQFFIAGSFFLEGSIKEKWKNFLANKVAVLITLIWLLHVVGLIWTVDLQEGLKDIRIKLPLLILPLVLAGSAPLSEIQYKWIFRTFITSVFVGSMVSMAVYAGIIEREIHSIREIFIFNISHIRFALFVCLTIFILFMDAVNSFKIKSYSKLLFQLVLCSWFIFFLIFIESITGLVILLITTISLILVMALRSSGILKRSLLLFAVIIIPALAVNEVSRLVSDYNVKHEYKIDTTEKTAKGNSYLFLPEQNLLENGYPIWVYVCDEELRSEWNSVSKIPFDSLDRCGQSLRSTLIRFLSSKGLKKDAVGLRSLNTTEIRSIEKGIANVKYQNLSSTRIRLIQIIWEIDQYRKGFDPSGHSVTQRFEFWKTAKGIITAYPIIGVGTGDMPQAYHEAYIKSGSKLNERYRLRAHNQYLAIAVALGIPATFFFVFVLLYALFSNQRWRDYLFLAYWIIAVLSMLTEDTLETQSGVTFFAFFFCLLLFSNPGRANFAKAGTTLR